MKFFFMFLFAFLISCTNRQKTSDLQTHNYYPTYTKQLEDSVQTLELQYISWFCACANWASQDNIAIYSDSGQLSDVSVFVEPADSSLELPDTIGYSGDLIKFTGQFYKEKGYPKNYIKNEEEVDSARVFRFTKYKILKSNYQQFITPEKKK